MFFKGTKIFLSAIAVFGVCTGELCALKNNDFTKADRSFNKTYRSEKSRLNDEKSRMNDEKFEAGSFKPEDNAEYIREKRFRGTDSAVADIYTESRFSGKDEKAYVPERNVFREEWTRDNTLDWENKNRMLNKDYEGRSDFSKRHPRDAEMRAFYENVHERSMQDINKYMFRSSHSSDPGIPITTAGAQLRGEDATETSFLEDLVFGRKQASRTPVSFKKNMHIGSLPHSSDSRPSGSGLSSQPQPGAKVLPPVVLGETQKTNMPQERKTKVYEERTDKVLMEGDDKKVKRGKTIIRVEVGQPKN